MYIVNLIRDGGVLAYPWCRKWRVVEKVRGSEDPTPSENPQPGAGTGTRARRVVVLLFPTALRRATGGRSGGSDVIEQKKVPGGENRRQSGGCMSKKYWNISELD